MRKELLLHVSEILKSKKLTVSTAESCTGGMLSSLITDISGSSTYFNRGIIAYNNEAKIELLGVKAETLRRWGAVSEQVAKEMAEGIKKQAATDIGISTTGIAGPLGGSAEKPVGLVFVAGSYKGEVEVEKHKFESDRFGNKELACEAALELILSIAKKL
ncbi:MAG TPA: CinA family protein [Thermoplasmata archaeon]|nr:CinA family protein [Thermoplasmata archaeon]HIH98541.1 CinA family protein [Thermoplasmata archaeon]